MSADFLDSNVIVYLLDDIDDRKRSIAEQIVHEAITKHTAIISFQVVQETLNVASRGLRIRIEPRDINELAEQVLFPLWKVPPSPELYGRALHINQRYQFSFYDSLIIAAALHAGCSRILSEDLQHGQHIEGVTIENPFLDS